MEIPQSYKGKPLTASWKYCAMDGAPLGVVGRYQNGNDKKDIVPFFKRSGSAWVIGIDLNPRPLFGLDKLVNHSRDKPVFIVEGEKCAALLHWLDITALTSLGGSKAANKTDWMPLTDYKTIYLLPDKDDAGEQYIKDVFQAINQLEKPPQIRIIRLPDLEKGGDIVNWVQTFANGWDGENPLNNTLKQPIREKLAEIVKNAESIPDKWNLAVLAGSAMVCFDEKKPTDIQTKVPPVPPLDIGIIPEPFKPWLVDVSHRMQTPPDFSTVSALVIVGSVIGSGCSIKPKQKDSWEVIPNLWGACIGRPSVALKSPSMKEPMQLLERLQAQYGEQYEQEKMGAEFDNLTNEAMLKDVKDKIGKAAKGKGKDGVVKADDIATLKANFLELTQSTPDKSTRRLFKANETSIQSMTEIQAGSRYFCESLFWASQPKQAAKT